MTKNRGLSATQALVAAVLALGAGAFVTAQQSAPLQKTQPINSGQVRGNAQATGSASGSASAGGGLKISGGGGAAGFSWGSNKPLFAVWFDVIPTRENQQKLAKANQEHTNYMQQLVQKQVLVVEGLFNDSTGYMAVIQAENLEAATKIISEDPAVQNGHLEFTLKQWQPRLMPGTGMGQGNPRATSNGIRRSNQVNVGG